MKRHKVKLLIMLFCTAGMVMQQSCTERNSKQSSPEVKTAGLYDSLRRFESTVNQFKITNPGVAQSAARKAVEMIPAGGDAGFSSSVYLLAGISYQLNNPDTAYRYYKLALRSALDVGCDTIVPRILYNMAMLYKNAYNYKDALNMLDSAQKMAIRLDDHMTASNCFNSVGNIQADLNNEAQAVIMFNRALKIAEDHNLPVQHGVALGSLARFEKDPAKVRRLQIRALNILEKQPGAVEQTGYLLINIGDDCRDPDSAISFYEKAIAIGSNGHIAEIEIAALNNMAYSYVEKNNNPAALALIRDRAIPLALEKKKQEWLSTLYDSYADILHRDGKAETAWLYQKRALEAASLADREHAANQVRLLNALLESGSREIRILEQEKVIGDQNKKVLWLYYLVIGLAAFGILAILLLILYIQRKNLRVQRQEIETAKIMAALEEQDRERMSMQLHDMIRPLKSAIVNQVGQMEFSDPAVKEELTGVLEKISASLRKASHRMNPVMRNKMAFSELCDGIRQDFNLSSPLEIKMEIFPRDLKLARDCSNHLYFILHELLTNADKYLGNGKVEISVSFEFENLYVLYKDNGGGFDPAEAMTKGLGLTLIRKRVALMGGHAEVESGVGKGTRWIISLPAKGNVS